MGHNLGMWHDCVLNGQYICSGGSKPRREDGRDCYGYMDYDPKTNKWSHCNVNDLRKANKQCLEKIGKVMSHIFVTVGIHLKDLSRLMV